MESTKSQTLDKVQALPLGQRIAILNRMKAESMGLRDSVFFAKHFLGIDVNPFQERVLKKLDNALFYDNYKPEDLIEMILNAGNRTGKTVLIAIIHIKFAYYKIGVQYGSGYKDFKYRTFAVSPIARQARECLKYIETILEARFTWVVAGVRYSNHDKCKLKGLFEGKNEALGELRYSNGSLTYAFPMGSDMGNNLQGIPAGLVTYDECTLSHHLEEELEGQIYPRFGDYGKLFMLVSTPNELGKSQQYFHHLVQGALNGGNKFLLVGGSYMENKFISKEKRESHARDVKERDPVLARQILDGEFVSTGGTMFDTIIIERIWTDSAKGKFPVEGNEYLISVDWGFAESGDETVMLVFDLTKKPFEIVHAYAKRGGDPYELMGILTAMVNSYNNANVIMDTESMGGTVMRKMLKSIKPIRFDKSVEAGVKDVALMYTKLMLTKNRRKILKDDREIELEVNFGWLRSFYLPKLANQLSTYRTDDTSLKQDWVIALAQGCYYIWKRFGDNANSKKSFKLNLLG